MVRIDQVVTAFLCLGLASCDPRGEASGPSVTAIISPADAERPPSEPLTDNPDDDRLGEAELPRVRVDTKYPPITGQTRRVAAGEDLQRAIDAAEPGDVILLEAGARFVGPFRLRAKDTKGWIVIRADVPDDVLPPEGTRLAPTLASWMPKLVTEDAAQSVITTESNARGYRLTGLEITADSSVAELNALVRFGSSDRIANVDILGSDFIIDRSFVHGNDRLSLRRCIMLNSGSAAVVDSYVSECHSEGSDSQAIVGWNGPGPYRIENNYLEGAGETIMFGGAMASVPGVLPSDIEVRGNHFRKPATWVGSRWAIKNLFEVKFGRRILVEANVFDGNWRHGQVGFAFVIKTSADFSWAVTEDVTIRLNRITNSGSGFALSGVEGSATTRARRITVRENVLDNVNVDPFKGDGRLVQIGNGVASAIFENNTLVSTGPVNALLTFTGLPPLNAFVFRDNIGMRGGFGVKGSGTAEGSASLATYAPGGLFSGNVIVGVTGSTYPRDNSFIATLDQIGFVGYAQGDYRLATNAPIPRSSNGGRFPGANVVAVDSATQKVRANP